VANIASSYKYLPYVKNCLVLIFMFVFSLV